MLYILLALQFIINLVQAQNLSYLNVYCKHYCKETNVILDGQVWWNNETIVDDQKEFLRFKFQHVHSEKLNLKLNLKEVTTANTSFYSLPVNAIINSTTEKITIIFSCISDIQLSFLLEITDQISNQSATIPFKKNCSSKYFNSSAFLIQINSQDKQKTWDVTQTQLIDNSLSTYFIIKPPKNATMYVTDYSLKLDSNNSEKAAANIKQFKTELSNHYITNEKYLTLNPRIVCQNTSNDVVNLYFNVTSLKLKDPIILRFQMKCTRLDSEIQNNQEFPIYIGIRKTSSEIYKAGVSSLDYVASKKTIPENKNAFQFYIYVKGVNKDQIKKQLFPDNSKFEIEITTEVEDDDILKIKNQNKLTLKNPDDSKYILLQFECQQQGSTIVNIYLQFDYSQNQTKTTEFSFTKICGSVSQKIERTLFGEVVYYGICIIAMLFGVQTIRLFTNLIKQEATVPPITIDTTYKKGYQHQDDEQQIEL